MTANQIAYASLLEAERHNKAVEDETGRHDAEQERIQAEANNIQTMIANTEANYKQAMIEYNNAVLDWKKRYESASLAEKTWMDQEKLNLDAWKLSIDENYNIEWARIEDERNANQKWANQEIKRHNETMESIEQAGLDLKGKQLEYQKHQWDTENQIAWSNYRLNSDLGWYKAETTYEIQQATLNYDYARLNQEWQLAWEDLDIRNEMKSYEKASLTTESISNIGRAARDLASSVSLLAPAFTKPLTGGKYVKEISKILFKD